MCPCSPPRFIRRHVDLPQRTCVSRASLPISLGTRDNRLRDSRIDSSFVIFPTELGSNVSRLSWRYRVTMFVQDFHISMGICVNLFPLTLKGGVRVGHDTKDDGSVCVQLRVISISPISSSEL